MQITLDCLLGLIENPFHKNTYELLKKSFIDAGRLEEAEAIDFLISRRFPNGSNSNNTDQG